MNLKKFKDVTTSVTPPDVKNPAYVDRLLALTPKKPKTNILPMISTIAAAVIILFGVAIWAIIGSGIRRAEPHGDKQITAPADKNDSNTQTDDGKKPDKDPEKTDEGQKKPDNDQSDEDNKTSEKDDGKKPDEQEPTDAEQPTEDNTETPDNSSDTEEPNNSGVPAPDPITEPPDREASADRANKLSAFDYQNSPLFNAKGKENKYAMPSFDIEMTSFVRDGTKLSDLKNKTLTFFVPDSTSWYYTDDTGKTVTEWEWFSMLKDEIGLNIKYNVRSDPDAVASASLQYIKSGKQLDLLYSAGENTLNNLCMSRDITNLININDVGSSPGVCKKTMDGYAMAGGYRMISPVGYCDVLWYNKTLSDSLGLNDPYDDWKHSVWTKDRFVDYLKTAASKTNLTTFVQNPDRAMSVWSYMFDIPSVAIDTNAAVPTVINNYSSQELRDTYDFIESAYRYTSVKSFMLAEYGMSVECQRLYKGTTLMSGGSAPMTDRSPTVDKIGWVPYPKSYCVSLGCGMLLPKRTVAEQNVGAALKFMELWASRATEAKLDNLSSKPYYDMTDDERREFYSFSINNLKTPLTFSFDYEFNVLYEHNKNNLDLFRQMVEADIGTSIVNIMKEYGSA